MEKPRLVNIRLVERSPEQVYIGRPGRNYSKFHWGNPFAQKNKDSKRAIVFVSGGRTKLCNLFDTWFKSGVSGVNTRWQYILTSEEPRRIWMIKNLHMLFGKELGCFCPPARCHGDTLVRESECLRKVLIKVILESLEVEELPEDFKLTSAYIRLCKEVITREYLDEHFTFDGRTKNNILIWAGVI